MPDRDLTKIMEKVEAKETRELAVEEAEFEEALGGKKKGKYAKEDEEELGAPELESPERPKAPPIPDQHVASNPVNAHAPVWRGRAPNSP
jgi:hypothetical protein